jgi:diguanylate cyclase (GGDEF)-like protein
VVEFLPEREPASAAEVPTSDRVLTAMSGLARVATAVGVTAEAVLRELCVAAAKAADVDGVGVMLADGGGLRFVDAQPRSVVGLERLQEALGQGPCYDSLFRQAAVIVEDVDGSDNWPLVRESSAWAGMRSVLAMPLLARGRVWGVLDLYRAAAEPWSGRDLVVIRALANVGASQLALISERDRTRAGTAPCDPERVATHDQLTGTPGRGLLLDRLEHALAMASRRRTSVAVLFIDIDGFKEINDVMGDAFGDVVLVESTRRFRLALRANDTLGRYGGDEFLVICEDLAGSPAQIERRLHALGGRIRSWLALSAEIDEVAMVISASIGAAVATQPHSVRELIGDAERAMSAARRAGGGRLVISGPEVVSLADYRAARNRA